MLRIRPNRPWAPIDLRELWASREILFLLILRDVKLRYRQTLLGVSWVVLQPLAMALVLATFLGLVVRPPADGIPYAAFLYAGLLPWTFFSNAVLDSSYSLITNSELVRKIYFPRTVLPAAAVGVRLVDLALSFATLLVLMLFYGVRPSPSALLLPLLVMNLVILAAGVGTWLSALNIWYRGVGTLLPMLLQLWMFASPIIYPARLVPEKWRWAYYLNPLAGIIENFRAALFNRQIRWDALFASAAVACALLVLASFSFRRLEDEFADNI